MTTHLTTHVLDASRGMPARGVSVALARLHDSGEVAHIADGLTDDNGRLALGPALLDPGTYMITFATGAYFDAQQVEAFYPLVTVSFTVAPAGEGETPHLHVPLLLSPFAYSTYRGS
ncbi:hydroxyisourate hydrolase [Microbacterium aquimaris]|uniref:hydroxyisourate hydrolase n=1 Tax=Microbacterium aquimaris TaxID=459816 RepID=UPI002AD22222|nr:hydroxyisourate hydrolase [Microbacterium aquimaris]MDZ8276396.1 hydroxyisourate hydrolase [Microbacterium aquimaris]